MKGIITILVLVAITTFPSCFTHHLTPTNLEDLPAFTTAGLNTFGCIVNGETHFNVHEEDIFVWYGGEINMQVSLPSLELNMLIPIYDRRAFNLVIDESDTVNTASLRYKSDCTYEFGKGKTGNVLNLHVRRFDRHVFAGTFSITAVDNCGNIDLKQGRFDVAFNR